MTPQRARVQAKLTVNPHSDAYEQEANRVAGQIMRMPDPGRVQRACADCGGTTGDEFVQPKCDRCQEEQGQVQRMCASCASERHADGASVESVIGRGGHPLPPTERAFFEPRFGRSFGHVRLHTDSEAADSARGLDALAYTKGSNIVFGAGQYAPGTESGRSLMAHELVHTVQQGTGGAGEAIQRACPRTPTNIGSKPPSPDCADAGGAVEGARIRFCEDSIQPLDSAAGILPAIASVLNLQSVVEVHGFASPDGPPGKAVAYNLSLSCQRANAAADVLAANGVPRTKIRTFKHGGTLALGTKEENRAVVIPVAHLQMFRASAISMLACAPCNPFTDDGLDAVTPPASASAIKSFRQKHTISAAIYSVDNVHIDPGSPGASGAEALGVSHYCNRAGTPFLVSRTTPSGMGTAVSSPVHGEGRQWESRMSSRVGVDVPCTLADPSGSKPGAPCGNLGPNPAIPAISSGFRLRLYADGYSETEFVPAACSGFPFHYLYEYDTLKKVNGSPVSPELDFHRWSTSTGVAEDDAAIGFKALRDACCARVPCPCECENGVTKLADPPYNAPLVVRDLCSGAAVGLMIESCPDPCAPMGTPCSTLTRPANP